MVHRFDRTRGPTEAMIRAGLVIPGTVADESRSLAAAEKDLPAGAWRAGSVRADPTVADTRALMIGCVTREGDPADPGSRDRMIGITCTGMRPKC
ncbi:SbtR family transcriptional regulator [Streptomyces sp. NPDC055006]